MAGNPKIGFCTCDGKEWIRVRATVAGDSDWTFDQGMHPKPWTFATC